LGDLEKKCRTLLIVAAAQLALGALFCAPARAFYDDEPETRSFLIRTRVRYWFASSTAQTRAYFVTPSDWWDPAGDNIKLGKTDTFKGMNSALPLFSAEVQPFSGFSGEFEAGDNRFGGGQFQEHTWLHAPGQVLYLLNGVDWYNPHHQDYSLSAARTKGTARQYSANVYLRIYKSRKVHREDDFELQHNTDLMAGYSWYENTLRLSRGYNVLSTDFFLPTPPAGPFPGLDSGTSMIWYGWHAGFREQARISDCLSAEGRAALGPGLRFARKSYWNLDTALANPGVVDKARGTLLDLSVSASWKFWRQFELDGGYQMWMYSASSGTRTYYYADGTRQYWTVDLVKTALKGMFLSLSWKY